MISGRHVRELRKERKSAVPIEYLEQTKACKLLYVNTKVVVISRYLTYDECNEWSKPFKLQNLATFNTKVNENEALTSLYADELNDEKRDVNKPIDHNV